MGSDLNKNLFTGRVVRDAELRYTPSGMAVCNFCLAVSRYVPKGQDGKADFFDFQLWDKPAEALSKYLTKGAKVAVDASARKESWEKDGQKHNKVVFNVNTIHFVGSAPKAGGTPAQASGPTGGGALEDDYDPRAYEDDIPF
jgi:single-strand DNA-binding protein